MDNNVFNLDFLLQTNDVLGAILEGYPKTKKQLYVSIKYLKKGGNRYKQQSAKNCKENNRLTYAYPTKN